MNPIVQQVRRHQARLRQCVRCPDMQGPPVHGAASDSRVLLVGQAPGSKEIALGRPFAWTAGKTLFRWFAEIGLDEADFRSQVYMAAVCRCFPGKNPKGGDRVPNLEEIHRCASWLDTEIDLLQPELILPVGKLAIGRFLSCQRLTDAVGHQHRLQVRGAARDLIPLPHPSGASTWHRTEPGKSLLHQSLGLIQRHPCWQALVQA